VIRLRPSWPMLVVVSMVVLAVLLRVAAASREGLWADEIFSLAMATGHSLEHPATGANPSLGDFVEPADAQLPAVFRGYTEHDERPAGAGRVVRAVLLSDTSPPLYYLLLNPWTRMFGTGDAALRLFSVWWAVLSLPLLWLVAREVGGSPSAAWTACLLFSFSPVAAFYSVEGRMYSFVCWLGLSLSWLSLKQSGGSDRKWLPLLWVLTGVAGLLTHYFFAFVWLACLAWLWFAGRVPRRRVSLLAGLTLLLVLPWYLQVPSSLARWRVSGDWLDHDLVWPRALGRPFALAAGLLSGTNLLGGWRLADGLVALLFVFVAVWIASRGSVRSVFSRRPILLWGWIAAACVGPLVFDLLRHTSTTNFSRYVVPALPAAVLLAALGLSQLPRKLHVALLSLILLAWLPGNRKILTSRVPRPWQPYTEVDARAESWAHPGGLVLVNSIPSGVIGVARYLRPDLMMASWVSQLGVRRVPGDLERLIEGRRRVALVKIHRLSQSNAPEEWLQAHARLLGQDTFRNSSAEVLYFGTLAGESAFGPPPAIPMPAAGPAE
jgi:Dolichyl-phosphate-mannose-protein mannosyltransferase